MSVRVLVAEDQALVRAGFVTMLRTDPALEVVGEAADGHEAVELAVRLRPDVLLVDVRMPRMDGLAATRAVRERVPATAVLVVSTGTVKTHVASVLAKLGVRDRVQSVVAAYENGLVRP